MEIVDIKTFVAGDVLIESDFMVSIEEHDWEQYRDKMVLIRGCSEIIIPTWAYMSVTAKLTGIAKSIRYGNEHSNLVIHRRGKNQTDERR